MPNTTRTVSVKLTDDEVLAKSDELVAILHELEAAEEAKKEAMVAFREKISAIEGRRDAAARVIEDRAEERDVECIGEPDYRAGKMNYRRADRPGDIIDSRPLGPEELQTTLDDAPKAGPKAKKSKTKLGVREAARDVAGGEVPAEPAHRRHAGPSAGLEASDQRARRHV